MPELLFELFSEEIPARMQAQAARDLQRLVTDALVERGVTYEGAVAHVTPRRLTLHVAGLPMRQPDGSEEKKGPRVGAPQAAIDGFLKSAGLKAIDEAKIVKDPKKGEFYVAQIRRKGRPTLDILAEILPQTIKSFPWPKSMRWGAASLSPSALRWVRPLHSIVATLGPENEEPDIIAFEVDGIAAGNVTYGHRFMAPQAFKVRRFDDYAQKLSAAKVVLEAERRRDMILHDARDLAFAQGLDLVEDPALLEEVAGLVEWPVVLMGSFDEAFLAIPSEVIRATIRANQKCFVLKKGAALANKFILVSNILAADGGDKIVSGNQCVVAARLADAKFFYETDLKTTLEARLPKLDAIVFHEKLGSQGERIARLTKLAKNLAGIIGADERLTERAARLAKADLVTEMVGEFPELQGLMGRYYAQAQGEDERVATAIEDHYRPQGPNDRTPKDLVCVAVALADKLDILAGFWAIDEKPTGSKDPYALRRAALGVIRLILENGLRLRLGEMLALAAHENLVDQNIEVDLLAFFVDRLKIYLRDKGMRYDLIDAVFSSVDRDDLAENVALLEALAGFLDSDDGKNLLAASRRVANILRAEEKKDGVGAFAGRHTADLRLQEQEHDLAAMIDRTRDTVQTYLEKEDFVGAMQALARLRAPVDAFFDKVTVNADDLQTRKNRLQLLGELREVMQTVADFSKIYGATAS